MVDLVDFDTLKTLLKLEKRESDYPDLILIRDTVKDRFEAYLGRAFDYGKHNHEQFVITETRMIGLLALPVDKVTSVEVGDVSVTDYKITSYGLQLGFPIENQSVSVVYKGGLQKAPGPLARAALMQTVFEYQNKENIGATIVNNSGGSISRPKLGLLEDVKQTIDQYKHGLNRFF